MDYMHPNAAPFFFEGGEHAVLMTHGFTGSCAHMRPLAKRLHEAGFTAQGILLPGHGTCVEDMRKADWQQWLKAELDTVHALKEKYRYVSVCGLSMGGDLSLIAAQQQEVTCCVPIAAPMKVKNRMMPLARFAAPFVPQMHWGSGSKKKDNNVLREYHIGYNGFATSTVEDLRKLMRMARKNLDAITCPLLAVQSRDDETISGDSADIIFDGVSSKVKEVLWLHDVPHVCTISKEMDTIADHMIAFLRAAENG